MKRASDVPPVVESFGEQAGDAFDGRGQRGDQRIVARQEHVARTLGPDDIVFERRATRTQHAVAGGGIEAAQDLLLQASRPSSCR
jgi:hypothetical protein